MFTSICPGQWRLYGRKNQSSLSLKNCFRKRHLNPLDLILKNSLFITWTQFGIENLPCARDFGVNLRKPALQFFQFLQGNFYRRIHKSTTCSLEAPTHPMISDTNWMSLSRMLQDKKSRARYQAIQLILVIIIAELIPEHFPNLWKQTFQVSD